MPGKKQGRFSEPAVFHIVGIGASAGGLEALEAFFDHLPAETGMAFVVVQHLSPDYKSLMVELLSRRTRMPVVRVEDGMSVEPNRIYLITPKKNMVIFHGKLLLTEQERSHINLPIDIFFRSLAEDQGARGIGIILSGTGSDGMRGVRAIKEAGGMVVVQAEGTAKFDGMPRSAISTGLVDFVLPPEEMPEQLLRYIRHPEVRPMEASRPLPSGKDEDNLTRILALLQKKVGVDFTLYKPNTVVRRIERRMNINQIERLEDYLRYLEKSPREITTLYKELLIGVTNFFRDGEAFKILQERVVPQLVENLPADGDLRIWSAGCSTGEEAYSLAILFQEHLEHVRRKADVKIFATDLDREALDFAAAGVYPESCAADVAPERLARYFVRRGDNYHIARKIREMVIFAHHNLLKDPPFTRIDLVICRNLLIYLQPAVQKKVLALFDFSLRPGGFLFLGSSETIGDLSTHFEAVETKWKIYRRLGDTRRILPEMFTPVGRERLRLSRPLSGHLRPAEDERFMEPLYQAIIQDFIPPAVVVDDNHDILHVFNRVDNYIRFPIGRLTTNIARAVHPDLASPLNTTLTRAAKTLKETSYQGIDLSDEEKRLCLDLVVRPFEDRRNQRMLFIVYFRNRRPGPAEGELNEVLNLPDAAEDRITDLERELQVTKENLQATIEELETSNEELQATNEELVSSNEELQSTNEELQSVNEELYTVNAEYQSKIQELVVLNHDMDNLLHSMSLGTIFLDERLNIRKFTPQVSAILNVQESDIGRPLRHLSHRLQYAALLDDVQRVLDTQTAVEKDVLTEDGQWVLMLISPYHKEGRPTRAGAVLTFVDITELKRAQLALQRERDLLSRTMDTTPSSIVITDPQGRVIRANRQALALLGLAGTPENFRFDDLLSDHRTLDGRPLATKELPARLALAEEGVHDLRYAARRPDGKAIVLTHNAKPLLDADGEPEAIIHIFRDIGQTAQAAADKGGYRRPAATPP